MASPKDITSFTGNMSDRFNGNSLKCILCLDELTERGLVEFPCCNNIFACLCCFWELVVVHQTNIAPCCRRPLNFVRSASSEMRRQIEQERLAAQRQLEQTQYERNRAERDLARIQTENRRFLAEQQDITYKITILKSRQEEQERIAKVELEKRLQQEKQELIRMEQLRIEATKREQAAREKADQYKEAQKRRRETERKINEYVAEVGKPKFPADRFTQVYQNLCKLLVKYPDMEEFILTTFAEIRTIDTLTQVVAEDLKKRRAEISADAMLQQVVRFQIMTLNDLEYTSPTCDLFYQNYMNLLENHSMSSDLLHYASRQLTSGAAQPIIITLGQVQFTLSYDCQTGFSFAKKTGAVAYTQLPTNVELNARLPNIFALCEVSNTDTTSLTAQTCFAAFTLDASDKRIIIHLLEYSVNELFGAEDVYISKLGETQMSDTGIIFVSGTPYKPSTTINVATNGAPALVPYNPFQVRKFDIGKCGRDVFHPTQRILKTCVRFY